MWYQSFTAMVRKVEEISGISESILLPQIRQIYQKHGTSEYSYLLEELPCLTEKYPGEDIRVLFDDAIHAYNSARKSSLHLYTGVRETLSELRSSGVTIILCTDSLSYYTSFRVNRLGLDELVDYVYSPPDHAVPASVVQNEKKQLIHAQHRHFGDGLRKPDVAILTEILRQIDCNPRKCIYVGDSLMKDVAMAQDAGIIDVLASYGGVQHQNEYELLKKSIPLD